LVLLGFLKVTLITSMLPIWKHMYLWSDKDGSSDTCQLPGFLHWRVKEELSCYSLCVLGVTVLLAIFLRRG
jgi:hypothetical protein